VSDTAEVKKQKPGTFSSTNQPKRRRSSDKIPMSLKETILAGLAAVGSDGAGAGSLRGYIEFIGRKYPKQAARLLERLLPPQVVIANNTPSQRIGSITIQSVASGTYLSLEERQRLEGTTPMLEHAAPQLEAPVSTLAPIERLEGPESSTSPQELFDCAPDEMRMLTDLHTSIEALARRVGVVIDND
jgi:hypothetical protein